eukprot:gene12886-18583_t
MTKDRDAFLSHNNEIHKEWMEANPGKKEEYQQKRRLDPRMRFDMIVHNLKSNNKSTDLNDLMSMEDRDPFIDKIQQPCHYCGAHDWTIFLCSLDRVDSSDKFTDCNTVPCCFQCNMIKITFHVDEFIGGVKAIAMYRGVSIDGEIPMNPRLGKKPLSRIRRVLPVRAYARPGNRQVGLLLPYDVLDNCRSCCSRCNYMKKDLQEPEYLMQVARINKFTSSWVIGDDTQYNTIPCGSQAPVSFSAYNGVTIVFPSHGKAVVILGRGKKLQPATISQYNKQALSVEDVLDVF